MSRIRVLGVPMDLGASRRGVDMGPSALRLAGLVARLRELRHEVEDRGNLVVPDRGALQEGGIDFLSVIAEVCAALAAETSDAVRSGAIPLVLGGDHSIGAGSVAGVVSAMRERASGTAGEQARVGVIWLDAHGDINTPTSSESGNVHGMPVAHLLGQGDARLAGLTSSGPAIRAEDVVFVGLRALDEPEREHIRAANIRAFTMRDVDERGMARVMEEAIDVASRGTSGIHVSLDADWIDPSEAPGVGTPVRGGATFREAHLAMEMVNDSGKLVSMDLVEVNPILDRFNSTAELLVDLVGSAFGRRIL